MLEGIAKGFKAARERFAGGGGSDTLKAALRDIRLSLLEADVDLDVAKRFLGRVQKRAEAEVVEGAAAFEHEGQTKEVSAYHRFVAICQEELEALMGPESEGFEFAPLGVTAVMMVGLQGSGKTTTSGKLARYLTEQHNKKVLMVAADTQRPAAIDQLETLGTQLDVPVHSARGQEPLQLCGDALAKAGKTKRDVVIFDTAGRLAIDAELMDELKQIKERTKPQEILLVVDAMIGQDAVRTAKAFDEALGLTGFVMTKLDGDARGGSALSIKEITGRPIKFLGTGERLDQLEEFRPEGLASRILGMGDVVGLVKEFERHVDQDKAEADAERMFRGQFDMGDFVEQIGVLKKMGSMQDLFDKMPMFQEGAAGGLKPDERELGKIVAVHDSMTPGERRRPNLVRDPGRLARVAKGVGRGEGDVLMVLNKFDTMRRMMIALGDQPSLLTKIPGFDQVAKVRQLRGLDMAELFGDAFELPPEEPPEPELSLDDIEVKKERREYFSGMAKPKETKKADRSKDKKKKQAAKRSRKKNRRR